MNLLTPILPYLDLTNVKWHMPQKRPRASYWLNCPLTDLTRDLPMVSKFKFVRCLETHKKILVSLDHEGTLEGLFYQGSPEKKN